MTTIHCRRTPIQQMNKSNYNSKYPAKTSKNREHERERDRSPRRSSKYSENNYNYSTRKSGKNRQIEIGIELTKNKLKTSLSAAINDLTCRENEGNASKSACRAPDAKSSADLTDTLAMQEAIQRIEEPGFKPTTFKSDANSSRKGKKMGKNETVDHDRAMFGALWASKEMEMKQQKIESQVNNELGKQKSGSKTVSRFPLAHERLSENPEKRNQHWLQLFRERRKMALDGTLGMS